MSESDRIADQPEGVVVDEIADAIARSTNWEADLAGADLHAEQTGQELPRHADRETAAIVHDLGRAAERLLRLLPRAAGVLRCDTCGNLHLNTGQEVVLITNVDRWTERPAASATAIHDLANWRRVPDGKLYCPVCWPTYPDRVALEDPVTQLHGESDTGDMSTTCWCGNSAAGSGFFPVRDAGSAMASNNPELIGRHPQSFWMTRTKLFEPAETDSDGTWHSPLIGCRACGAVLDVSAGQRLYAQQEDLVVRSPVVGVAIPPAED